MDAPDGITFHSKAGSIDMTSLKDVVIKSIDGKVGKGFSYVIEGNTLEVLSNNYLLISLLLLGESYHRFSTCLLGIPESKDGEITFLLCHTLCNSSTLNFKLA